MGQFKLAHASALSGASKRAFFVTKQLALHQIFRNGPAVHNRHQPLAAPAHTVDGAGQHLLAGAAFAADKYGGIRCGDLLHQGQNIAYGSAVAQQGGFFQLFAFTTHDRI